MTTENDGIIKQLTAGELKRLLADVPDDYWVRTEGCDCTGPADGITTSEVARDVIINRNDRIEHDTHVYDPKDWD